MFNFVRHQEFLEKQGKPYFLAGGHLWTLYQKMVVPVGPVSQNYSISVKDFRNLLKYFKSAILVRSTTGFVDFPEEWYCVIRDKFIPVADMASKEARSKTRKGLKFCTTQKIDPELIRQKAWPIFSSAIKLHKNPWTTLSEREFRRNVVPVGFEDVSQYWGAFENATGRLIAYAQNYCYGKIEVNYSTIKVHPDFLNLYPGWALFYEMDKYYLEEQQFSYLNSGFRNLLHETNIEELLIKKYSYKKQPVGLQVCYRPFVAKGLNLLEPFYVLFRQTCPPLSALQKFDKINKFMNNNK